ncbi:MAG: hypothetical protein J7L83_04320, partial [Thaumarchaeota archaeon]|nr:hypothetical protein [Nitrososphaerota archaeon]
MSGARSSGVLEIVEREKRILALHGLMSADEYVEVDEFARQEAERILDSPEPDVELKKWLDKL